MEFPQSSVAVTVYTVVDAGVTDIEADVPRLDELVEDQRYV